MDSSDTRNRLIPGLKSDVVHVWQANLRVRDAQLHTLSRFLSPDEDERASRFRFQIHRDRFVACRGFLRVLLGYYLRLSPEEIRIAYGPWGKPCLAEQVNPQALRFNLSHSQDLALFAIAIEREVGVDVEMVDKNVDWASIARQSFNPREVAALAALPTDRQPRAICALWTRKEARAKALGEGLQLPLDRLSDTVQMDPSPPLSKPKLGSGGVPELFWWVQDLPLEGDYVAVLAVERRLEDGERPPGIKLFYLTFEELNNIT